MLITVADKKKFIMKTIMATVLLIFILPCYPLNAAIKGWKDIPHQFYFGVDFNGGLFCYPPATYYIPDHHAIEKHYYNPAGGTYADYDYIASGALVEFLPASLPSGKVHMNAMAKGPDFGINTPNTLLVQAYAETIPVDLDDQHGVDVRQRAASWINHRFTVSRDDLYLIDYYLNALVDFDQLGTLYNYQSAYSITGEINLKQLVLSGSDVLEMNDVPGFPIILDGAIPNNSLDAQLFKKDEQNRNLTYQLTIALTLESTIVNIDHNTGYATGLLSGTFQLGTADNPVELGVSLTAVDLNCISKKLKSAAVLSNAVFNCASKEIANPDKFDYDSGIDKAETKFENTWEKVEAGAIKKGMFCSDAVKEDIEDMVMFVLEDVFYQISDGIPDLDVDKNARNLGKALLKAAGKKCMSLLKAESANIKKQNPEKLEISKEKAHEKFMKSWAKAENKAVVKKGVAYTGPTDVEVELMIKELVDEILSEM